MSRVGSRGLNLGDLFDTAVAMRRARFLREHPGASDVEADGAVEAWLTEPRDDRDPIFVPVTSERLRGLLERARGLARAHASDAPP